MGEDEQSHERNEALETAFTTALAQGLSNAESETHQQGQHHAEKSFQIYYYQCDQIGAPQELTDEQGKIVWAASYKVWGETEALQFLKTGTNDASADSYQVFAPSARSGSYADAGRVQSLNIIDQPLRFQGQYFDQETGLHYNRFRYYDAIVGRFVHQDPIGLVEGDHCYQYAANPIGWLDPIGLTAKPHCPICGLGCHGRSNKQAKLRELLLDNKQPKWVRGWIKNELRHIETGNRKTIRLPGNSRNSKTPGKELAHGRTTEAKDGYCYLHSELQDADLHKLQHKIGGY